MSSLAVLKKSYSIFRKSTDLANFDYLGPHSKSIFSTYRQKIKKSLASFVANVARNIVLNFELSIFRKVRGALAVLQVDIFQNPWF